MVRLASLSGYIPVWGVFVLGAFGLESTSSSVLTGRPQQAFQLLPE